MGIKDITVRFCAESDEALWVALNQEFIAFEVGDNDFWQGLPAEGDDKLRQTFQKALQEPEFITLVLIEAAGETVGFANLMTIFSVWAGGRALILDDLYIKQEHQGQGLGRQFMSWLTQYAQDHDYERLQFQSEHSNPGAHEFYLRLGYEAENMYFYVKYIK